MFDVIHDVLKYRARSSPARTGLIFEDREITYGEMYRAALGAASYLREHGLGPGMRFGILDFNSREIIDLVHGAAVLGAVPVILNWRLSREEMEFILEDAGCEILFRGTAFSEMEPRGPRIVAPEPIVSSDSFSHASSETVPGKNDDLLQLYTSGTTGLPKGVRTTHGNMLALMEQLMLEVPGFGSNARNLVCAPFFHIAGVGYWMFGLMGGVTNVLLRRFEPEAAALALERYRITHTLLVPAMQQAVLNHLDMRDAGEPAADFSALRHILYGASPISETLLRRSAGLFHCDYTQAYGLTETTGVATLLNADDHRAVLDGSPGSERTASAGRGAAGMEIRIVDQDGVPVEAGESGEVEISGPTVMPGYWRRDEENTRVLREGRLLTGDVGYLDGNGYLFLRDRKKDLIISGGEKVYPIEVERILMSHPAVRDAAVVGIPDENFGEAVCAFIVTEQEDLDLREWVRPLLPAYRAPREYRFIAELPRNPSGKVLRRELREPFWEKRDRVIA